MALLDKLPELRWVKVGSILMTRAAVASTAVRSAAASCCGAGRH